MKMPRLVSAAMAFLLLTGCGSSEGSGNGMSLSPDNVWGRGESSKAASRADVSSRKESKAPALTKDKVTMNRTTEYFYDLITEERLRQGSLVMLDGLRSHSESISFEGLGISEKELNELFDLMICCDPELGWIDYNYEVDHDEGDVIAHAYFTYKLSPEEEKTAVEKLRAEVSKVAAETEGYSDFDRVLYFHDYIIAGCDYSEASDSAWSAYGCLIDGKAVCEGYSKALIALCEETGMLCLPVGGSTDREGQELHMWNKVMMDGEWYNMDLTWDDPTYGSGSPVSDDPEGAEILHREYFGLTDEEVLTDHSFLETSFLKYPEAKATEDNFFVRTGACIGDVSEAQDTIYSLAAKSLDSGGNTFQLKCADSGVYEAVYNEEFSDDGAIFDVLDALWNNGYPIEKNSYRFIPDESHCIVTLILES
ncbi:Transglutaminase-like superfamily protein [Ruminococcaceae bacterium FB2012]|nr:Transglutaminase-like superfamily protein [Ruminococcaceae bacterium FB2012]